MRKNQVLTTILMIILLVYVVHIPLLLLYIMNEHSRQDAWIGSNSNNIHQYVAEVTKCKYHYVRGHYYEIELDISNGAHLKFRSEEEMKGCMPIYSYASDEQVYYEFTKEKLFYDVNKGIPAIYLLVIVLLVAIPVAIIRLLGPENCSIGTGEMRSAEREPKRERD